jgi:hypothetical protein
LPLPFAELWQNARLKTTNEFTAPPMVLQVGDSIVGTLGNFSTSTGKAKNKKTFNVCAIVASALTNGIVLLHRSFMQTKASQNWSKPTCQTTQVVPRKN